MPPQFYVGKYKGIPIKEIEDLGYLNWAYKNMKMSVALSEAVYNQIHLIEEIGK